MHCAELAAGGVTPPEYGAISKVFSSELMQRFGEAFYGRRAAYGAALAAAGTQELEKALARNIFEVVGVDQRAARLARYARAAASQLDAEEDGALMAGTVTFPNPEAFAHA